jgi:hypothetical protein
MADIYRNAILTIAASNSSSDTHGFLLERTRHLSTAFIVDHKSFPEGKAAFRIRERISKHLRHDVWSLIRDSWRSDLIGPAGFMEPLDYRAWTFQERLVSTRLRSFGSRELEWDCNSCCDCECGARYNEYWSKRGVINLRNASTRETYQLLILSLQSALSLTSDTEDMTRELQDQIRGLRSKALKMWRMSIVPTYTKLALTREGDRLPALSALAAELSRLLNDTYLCGMWMSDLPVGLNWTVGEYGANNPKNCHLHDQYRAPSWSWTSLVGPVDFVCDYEDDFEPLCELKGAAVIAASGNQFGDACSGYAHMVGHLVPGQLEWRASSSDTAKPEELSCHMRLGEKLFSFRPDTLLAENRGQIIRAPVNQALNRQRGASHPSGEVFAFATLIRRTRSRMGFIDKSDRPTSDLTAAERSVTFLILSKHQQEASDCDKHNSSYQFTRLGLMEVSNPALPEDWHLEHQPQEIILI